MLCLCLREEIIDEEECVLPYEAYRLSNLPFPHSAYEKFSLANAQPNVKPISEWKTGKFRCFFCVFLFVISHLVPEIFKIFVLCKLGTDDVIRCVNMEVKTQNREYLCK